MPLNEIPSFVDDDDDGPPNEVEDEILRFVDEPRVQHNVIPESYDSGDEEEDVGRRRQIAPYLHPPELLAVGQVFWDKQTIKSVVLDHALQEGRNIKQDRFDKNKMGFSCVGGNCEWRIYCAISAHSDFWVIRSYKDKHSCVPNGKCEMFKVPQIARLFLGKIREEPDYYMPMKIEEIIKDKWKINVSRHQCQSARKKALKWIETAYDEQFGRLREYAAEILDSNPNSTVVVETYRSSEGLDLFDKIYVCFEGLKKAWKENCRPLIGVDGCFMKSKMKGQLLVALGRDGDNCMFPAACAVVQVEDTPNWMWFLNQVKADLDLDDGLGYVIVSDRQKGLINAVKEVLPYIEHMYFET